MPIGDKQHESTAQRKPQMEVERKPVAWEEVTHRPSQVLIGVIVMGARYLTLDKDHSKLYKERGATRPFAKADLFLLHLEFQPQHPQTLSRGI
jgi:hypothetical protein